MKTTDRYEDIINLPHHVSPNRKQMPVTDRAAQFAAFAALKGYDEEIEEAARHTEQKIEPDADRVEELNEKLTLLLHQVRSRPLIKLIYFCPDKKKSGGRYVTVTDNVTKMDVYSRKMTLSGGVAVPFDDVYDIELL